MRNYFMLFSSHLPTSIRQSPLQALHIVLVPFTTAFYNIVALVGLFPALEVVEKKTYHHLRYIFITNVFNITEFTFLAHHRLIMQPECGASGGGAWFWYERQRTGILQTASVKLCADTHFPGYQSSESAAPAKVDVVADRRRAKALKVHTVCACFT